MQLIPGYETGPRLHAGRTSVVHRARRLADGIPVVLKVGIEHGTPVHHAARFKRELDVLRSIDSPRVIRVYGMERHGEQVALVLEDIGADSLTRVLARGRPLAERLGIAVELAAALSDVHAAGIIHRDLNPDSVVCAPGGALKLVGFGISTRAGRNPPCDHLEGTLPYLAPEQTGRTSRPVDQRSDLYSLGATLYQIFTGRRIHESDDILEMIHFHVAVEPRPPHVVCPEIPAALSAVVLKLLAKAPEQRYQSASGVRKDLEACRDQFAATGTVAPFPLAAHDLVNRFEVSPGLHGREAEVAALTAAFTRAFESGTVETVVVAGHSGVGKSTLVRQLAAPVTRRRGHFVTGKFEQLGQSVPYRALIDCFRGLIDQILTESNANVARWRRALQGALGPSGRVIADLIPEIELIVGPQPAVAELGPAEARNRLHVVFETFIQVFCRRSHPLVLFVNDLHWADRASLDLLARLTVSTDAEALLLVLAYRDNETAPDDPLLRMLDEQRSAGARMTALRLAPLGPTDVALIVASALRQDIAAVAPLAEVVCKKTGGNPFFVTRLLHMLHDEGLIRFVAEERHLTYDIAAIREIGITDNVADIVLHNLQRLPEPSQRLLRVAGAMGNRFDLDTLAAVSDLSPEEVARWLAPAVEHGLVMALATGATAAGNALVSSLPFVFVHDRVQQAAYSMVPEADREALHLSLGRALARRVGSDEARLFEIVGHLNRGAALVTDLDERLRLAGLNLRAAARARTSSAYDTMVKHLRAARPLLGDDAWREHYQTCYEAHLRLADGLYLSSDIAGAFAVADEAAANVQSPLDLVPLVGLKTDMYVSLGQLPRALACALEGVSRFGLSLPGDRNEIRSQLKLKRKEILAAVAGRDIVGLADDLPAMRDPDTIALARLLARAGVPAYQVNPELMALVACHLVELSLLHGNCSMSAYGYVSFGASLSAGIRDHENAYRFGKLALEVAARYPDPAIDPAVRFTVPAFISALKRPAAETIAAFRDGVRSSLECGNLVYAGYNAFRAIDRQLVCGAPLGPLLEEALDSERLLRRIGEASTLATVQSSIQLIRGLRGELPDTASLDGGGFDEERVRSAMQARGGMTELSILETNRLRHRYLLDSPERAHAMALAAEAVAGYTAGFLEVIDVTFYGALARTAIYSRKPAEERPELDKQLDAQEATLEGFARLCPENYRHLQLTVAAERARLRGEPYRAMELFDQAIACAAERDCLHVEAIARELAGRMWLGLGRTDLGRSYLRRARAAYDLWGATAKVARIDAEQPELPAGTIAALTSGATSDPRVASMAHSLDLHAVVKASQAISGRSSSRSSWQRSCASSSSTRARTAGRSSSTRRRSCSSRRLHPARPLARRFASSSPLRWPRRPSCPRAS